MPSVKVRATTPPAFRLCSSLSKRALDFNTSRYERTKLKLTLLWDCVVSFILLSKKCLFSYLDHQPCFKLLARKPVPHFGDSRSAFSLCSSQLNGERCAVTYSHAISNLTPPVSSSMAQLFGDSDPLKQHRRICSLSTFYFVYTSGLFSCFVRIDGWPQLGGVVNYASSFKPCTDSYSCECISHLRVNIPTRAQPAYLSPNLCLQSCRYCPSPSLNMQSRARWRLPTESRWITHVQRPTYASSIYTLWPH